MFRQRCGNAHDNRVLLREMRKIGRGMKALIACSLDLCVQNSADV